MKRLITILTLALTLNLYGQKAIEADAVANEFWQNLADIPTAPLDSATKTSLAQVIGVERPILTVRNNTGTLIAFGKTVRISGSVGQVPTIALADNTTKAGVEAYIGIVTQAGGIANNTTGEITCLGLVENLDTSAATEGDIAYVGASGAILYVEPTGANFVRKIGLVKNAHPTLGSILLLTDYRGSALGNDIKNATTAAAVRTLIDSPATAHSHLAGDITDIPLDEITLPIVAAPTTVSPFENGVGNLNSIRVVTVPNGNTGIYTIDPPAVEIDPPPSNTVGIVGPYWVHNRDTVNTIVVFGTNLLPNHSAYIRYKLSGGSWIITTYTDTSGELGLKADIDLKAPLASPSFTGTVISAGDIITDGIVGVGSVGSGSRFFANGSTGANVWIKFTDGNMYMDSDGDFRVRTNAATTTVNPLIVSNSGIAAQNGYPFTKTWGAGENALITQSGDGSTFQAGVYLSGNEREARLFSKSSDGIVTLHQNGAERFRIHTDGNLRGASGSSLTFAANSGTWDGSTFGGDQTFTGAVSVTGQTLDAATKVVTRETGDDWEMLNIGKQFQLTLTNGDLSNSGTGSSASWSPSGISVASGTSTSGYGRGALMYGTGGATFSTPFQRPMAAAFAMQLFPNGVTDTNSVIRFIFGDAGVPPVAEADALSARGFGCEIAPDGTNWRIRCVTHDGTTYTAGAWVNFANASLEFGYRGLQISSDGAGNISATITGAYGDTSTVYTATTTGGPTTQGAGPLSSLSVHAVNESTGTPVSILTRVQSAIVRLE